MSGAVSVASLLRSLNMLACFGECGVVAVSAIREFDLLRGASLRVTVLWER